jgi:O-antigen ligase
MFAEYVAIFIPILLIRVTTEKIFLKQLIWIPMLVIAIMLLLSTATRGAFLSMIAGIVYLVWIARRILNFQKLLPVLIAAFATFYVSSIVLSQYTSSASLFTRLGQTKIVSGMPDTRARVWTDSWNMIKERPWIGHGPYYFIGVDEKNVRIHQPHSLFLWMAYIIGIPGALLFYYILVLALRKSYQAARRYANRRSDLAFTVVLLSSILVIFLVDEIKISFMRYENTQQFTWTMLGLLISASRVAFLRADEEERAKLESAPSDG